MTTALPPRVLTPAEVGACIRQFRERATGRRSN